MKTQTYEQWFEEVRKIAKSKGYGWLIPANADYESIFHDGATPEEAFEDELDAARSSC